MFDVYKFAPEDIRYLVSLDLEVIRNSNDLGIELMCWIGKIKGWLELGEFK